MSGAIPSLPSTPLWPGAQLNYGDDFTFIFAFIFYVQRVSQSRMVSGISVVVAEATDICISSECLLILIFYKLEF
jgi:hypothetical protein